MHLKHFNEIRILDIVTSPFAVEMLASNTGRVILLSCSELCRYSAFGETRSDSPAHLLRLLSATDVAV
jgi:hypothetical protein